MAYVGATLGYYSSRPFVPESINYLPEEEPSKDYITIYDSLNQDRDFSIMTQLIDKGDYSYLLSDPTKRFTLFAFPDSVISEDIKSSFSYLDNAESKNLIGIHLMDKAKLWHRFAEDKYIFPTYHRTQSLYVNGPNMEIGISGSEIFQKASILGTDNVFKNGIVMVIDRPLIPSNFL